MSCKCVCKPWTSVVETQEFVDSHLSKSNPGLLSQQLFIGHVCKVSEFNPCCNESFTFIFPEPAIVKCSVDGLLFLSRDCRKKRLYVCNPVTREYIELPHPPNSPPYSGIYGFGVSRITRQYKVVMIAAGRCEVYTLGTGCWRSIPGDTLETGTGVFLNGNLHWLASDSYGNLQISCLDLETELFSTLAIVTPPYCSACRSLTILGDRLCFLGGDSDAGEINVWSMKVYGDEKSWTREFVIKDHCLWCIFHDFKVVKVFEDGDILLAMGRLVRYSSKMNVVWTFHLPGLYCDAYTRTFAYTPSFLPTLKSLAKENVRSL